MPGLVSGMAITAIRSFAGILIALPTVNSTIGFLLPVGLIFAGKALGGYLTEKFGMRPVAVCASAFAIVCLVIPLDAVRLMSAFFINIPCAVNLMCLAKSIPNYPSTAFGILCASLHAGLLAATPLVSWPGKDIAVIAALAVSIVLFARFPRLAFSGASSRPTPPLASASD